jgi:hypothetical protein
VLFAAAHASTSAINEDGIRAATWGSRPLVEGRLSLFGATFIDFFISRHAGIENYFALESGGQSLATCIGFPPLCTVGAAELEPPASGRIALSQPPLNSTSSLRHGRKWRPARSCNWCRAFVPSLPAAPWRRLSVKLQEPLPRYDRALKPPANASCLFHVCRLNVAMLRWFRRCDHPLQSCPAACRE